MKRFIGRILLCVTPVVVSLLVVGWAYAKYMKGEGGFRLGVDLSGGTILVYEVDAAKMTPEALRTFKPEDLAAVLKRRIDPADLHNVTIRPVPGDPPRVEIILPTGGPQQAHAVREKWDKLLVDVRKKFDDQPEDVYKDVPTGQINELINQVIDSKPTIDGKPVDAATVANTIHELAPVGSEQRSLTEEEIKYTKNQIQQQGRLEFRILADKVDDKDAIDAASAYMKDPKNAEILKAANAKGEPPPPPTQNGDRYFAVNVGGESTRQEYSWVEVGKVELYSLQLNSAAENTPNSDPKRELTRQNIWAAAKPAKDKEAFTGPGQTLYYYRTITPPGRVSTADHSLGKTVEFFVLTRETERGKEITGDYLTSVREGQSEGKRAVDFSFNADGANLFYELSNRNKPTGTGDAAFKRELAVILDGQVQSAPVLNSAISSNGQISGDFTQKEIENLVNVLRAGALPATLKRDPVSERMMGPTLGQYTINHGAMSIGIAFAAVLLFMLVYYRFAGVVACIALLSNLLLTVAFMVLVSASFTLPGLAGLVLMLGMAVDANVLIYERLREERERGASLALAVRNGYDRAFPTIIDTHLTSIFTAIVLYVVGNDQLKGFGISLTVGLLISLFTSLVMTRTMFDIWMAQNWLHKLTFMQLFKRPNINFMRIRHLMFGLTGGATILGAALFIYHLGNGGLNIDFVGGTAYAGLLKEPQNQETLQQKVGAPLTQDDLRKLNAEAEPLNFKVDGDLPQDTSVVLDYSSVTVGDRSNMFTVRTTEKNAPKVQLIVNYKLGDLLKRIQSKDPQITEVKGRASEASLEFIKQNDKGEDVADYASVAQVTRLLDAQFRPLDVQHFTVKGQGKEEEGRFAKIEVKLEEPIPAAALTNVMAKVRTAFQNTPQPERLENFDSALARDTQQKALYAILASWIAILLYLWFRFGSWTFGAATVLCLIHDLFFTLGAIALCHFVYKLAPGLSYYLGVEDFKIDLPSIAALLTLVGYSVSDTIVVFDRIREVRGKNPMLTYTMINDSVNQTLSRTILSSLTVFLVVGVLYVFGGEGVRLFSFVMVVGVVVGTYSSIYIASPLLIMFGEGAPKTERERIAAAAHAAAADAAAAQA